MHLLYVDESGSTTDPNAQHYVLAGVSFFERSTHWVEQRLNAVAEKHTSGPAHDLELHGSPMHGGRGQWRKIPTVVRRAALEEALQAGVRNHHDARVFVAVIRQGCAGDRDPVELAFEEVCRRFDLYLAAMKRRKNPQRGIMIFDKCNTENRIQHLARHFKYNGHSKGTTRNYAEVPLFMDSRASRLIQLADLISYAFFRKYEYGDDAYYKHVRDNVHAAGGTVHGLFERT